MEPGGNPGASRGLLPATTLCWQSSGSGAFHPHPTKTSVCVPRFSFICPFFLLFPTPHLTKSHLPSLPLHLPRKCCPSVVSGSLSGQPRPQPERIVTGNPSVNNIESTEGAECLLPEPWAWGSLRCGPESLFHSSLPSFPSSLFLPQGKQLHQIFAP